MKKFYALALSVALATTTVSAFNSVSAAKELKFHSESELTLNKELPRLAKGMSVMSGEVKKSREETADIDLSKIDVMYYSDLFADEGVDVMTALFNITKNEDGTVSLNNVFGYEGVNFTGSITKLQMQDGSTMDAVEIPAGQMAKYGQYDLILVTLGVDENKQLYFDDEGTMYFVLEDDYLAPRQYGFGLYAMQNGQGLGAFELAYFMAMLPSNATITYQELDAKAGTTTDVSKRMYVELYQEEETGAIYFGMSSPLSDTAVDNGNYVDWAVDDEIEQAYASDACLYYLSLSNNSSRLYNLTAYDLDTDATSTDVQGQFIYTEGTPYPTGFQWDSWVPLSDEGYWFGYICVAPTVITFDTVEEDDPSGITSINNDKAAKEYYNLQGVKVANPTAGQLYIVKQGNKVSKVILK